MRKLTHDEERYRTADERRAERALIEERSCGVGSTAIQSTKRAAERGTNAERICEDDDASSASSFSSDGSVSDSEITDRKQWEKLRLQTLAQNPALLMQSCDDRSHLRHPDARDPEDSVWLSHDSPRKHGAEGSRTFGGGEFDDLAARASEVLDAAANSPNHPDRNRSQRARSSMRNAKAATGEMTDDCGAPILTQSPM